MTHRELGVGWEVRLGGVTVSVHVAGASETAGIGFDGHDRFVAKLEAELGTAKMFGRSAAQVMARGDRSREARIGPWFPRMRNRLRAFDRMAPYCADTVELTLPAAGERQAVWSR